MPQLVDIPDVGTVEFPDDATLDEITQAANERFTKTVSARGMGNAFLREGQRGTGNLLEGAGAAVETLPDFGMMEPGVRNPAVQRQARDERARYATETPGQKLARIQRNPIYVAGQALEETAPETHPVPPQEENSFATKAAGMAGGFVPLVAAGAAGPAVIGLQSAGQHISSDFEQAKQQGLSDDAAAELALKRATESGTLQAGIFFALPAPVRAVAEKYLVAKQIGRAHV